jgi:Ca2+-binding EF-hand superfamily protein
VNAFCEKLDISAMDVRMLVAEVDADGDGRIAYQEFVPLAVDLLETLLAARRHDAQQEERKEEASKKAEAFLFHGLSKEQLQGTLRDMFEQADTDKSGQLSRDEFESSLRHSSLGLTRREINALLMEADENCDGQVSYEEFEPICVEVLLEMVASQFEHARLPQEEVELREMLLALAKRADPEDSGRLHLAHVQQILVDADLGLTTVQTHALLAEASVDDDSSVEYAPFIDRAASILAAILQVQTSAERAAALEKYRGSAQQTHIDGMGVDEWAQALADRLVQLDTEGNGAAYTGDIAGLLSQEMGFDDGSVRAVLSYAASMSDAPEGMVALQAVLDGAADIVLQRQEQNHLAGLQ